MARFQNHFVSDCPRQASSYLGMKAMLRMTIGAVLFGLASPVAAQEIHSLHCLNGCPAGAPSTNDLVIREIYVLSSNDLTKFADWVAYRITAETIGSTQTRTWKPDPLLDNDETLEPADYTDAHAELGTDRGHQAPLASFTGTVHWKDTNFLSNITPQRSDLNQGPWVKLESAARDLARRTDIEAVYVMTGPLYERHMDPLPQADEPHLVPSGYWKVLAVEQSGNISVAAFVFDQNTSRSADVCAHTVTVREVEQRSGLNLFHALERTQQDAVETGLPVLAAEMGC